MSTQTLTGPVGTATRVSAEALTFAPTCIAAWFLDLPPAHPHWPRYLLSVVDLAPHPGLADAVLHYPEAQYELLIIALNPERDPQPNDPDTWQHLMPLNVVVQFHGVTRAQAEALVDEAAQWCVDGRRWVETQDVMGERDRWKAEVQAEAARLGQAAAP
ncbi:hypothetical protein WDJ50_18525 (plasmid) [Deinococcus sp. VB142]|uniref:Uncharacterized protein n=1 Tax=Deinococcus sp. VB142 TaxID=3112952 RepID=A0AAU6Q7W3_9DEIO